MIKRNIIDLKTQHRDFKTPGLTYCVSSRGIAPEMSISDYLKIFYIYADISQVESLFGNAVFPSRLYGGRSYQLHRSLTDAHLEEMADLGIGLSMTLTNHFFDEDAYNHSRDFLRTHHKKGNAIICVNDELAGRIRDDFPDYTLKASIIKNIRSIEAVERYLELYDYVVPPMDMNDDDEFLQAIKEKDRILLFGNANCAYTCPARTCYYGFSQANSGKQVTSKCSREKFARLDLGAVYFDIKKFKAMGFSYFKLVPLAPVSARDTVLHFSRKRSRAKEPLEQQA